MINKEKNLEPLVSVVVITYNSSKYVLETLESIKKQYYTNIELIISDDCSTDNTVDLCHDWINKNKKRFIRTEIISAKKNNGIPANCNRGVNLSNGEWIKIIAGDDALKINGINDVINEVIQNSSIRIILTQVETFNETFIKKNSTGTIPKDLQVLSENSTTSEQIEWLLIGNYLPAPGIFFKKSLIEEIGAFNEKFSLLEDMPFFLKVLRNGIKIYYRDIPTVNYRKHSTGITKGKNKVLPAFYNQYSKNLLDESLLFGNKFIIINNYWHRLMVKIIFMNGNKGSLSKLINDTRINLQPRRIFRLVGLMN